MGVILGRKLQLLLTPLLNLNIVLNVNIPPSTGKEILGSRDSNLGSESLAIIGHDVGHVSSLRPPFSEASKNVGSKPALGLGDKTEIKLKVRSKTDFPFFTSS
ncbi:hypothetical protein PanWU01x14_101620 [Parasponia andersonii]|uniref:Uncharacterized protein n=1 Tax=Parasponia andersonii TaxID=3476 RepID=A0A2P5D385_PARAD|nr:hypothetical protein PanWU01x14_101620 [Parasponia andersonii]